MLKKRICVSLVIISGVFLLFYGIVYNANNKQIKIVDDVFIFCHTKNFNGNRWDMYVNSKAKKLCSFIPWDGMTKKEMKNKFYDDIVMIYSNQEVRVYCIKDLAYNLKQDYPIVYTLNGYDFHLWNEDIVCSKEKVEKRLEKLYKYVSMEKIKQYSWRLK